jgi:uncharacterized protein YbjT (DUF2867 family)
MSNEGVALLAGATGLVGGEILRLLAHDDRIKEVRTLVRRSLPEEHKSPKVRECMTDFTDLQNHPDWFDVDLVFSALGTTIAKARSQEAFRKVDYDLAFMIAKTARDHGARHFLFVSALGADARSPFFYNRVKGELENAVTGLGYPSVTIARPSLLLGVRHPRRLSEELVKPFARFAPPPLRPVKASQVAAALVHAAFDSSPGVRIINNRRLRAA